MLTTYAAFAILGAYIANKLRVFIDKFFGFKAGTVLLVTALIASFFWSVPMALKTVFYNGALIVKPF